MASVRKRSNKYSVVYYYEDETTGERKQKWETYDNKSDAYARKIEVEAELNSGTYVQPTDMTLSEFFEQYVDLYGSAKWGESSFRINIALYRNYIQPELGNLKITDIKRLQIDQFYKKLKKTKHVEYRGKKSQGYLKAPTIEKISKLMSTMFKQAVLWNIIKVNPTIGAIVETPPRKKRDIWTADVIKQALDKCEDNRLYLAIHLSFACSLRLGEVMALKWDCVHISDDDLINDNAWIYIDKTLTRINVAYSERIDDKGIIQHFPSGKVNARTHLVLKTPKTESSVRKVWVPKTLAMILRDWRAKQEELQQILGSAYMDFGLVVTHNDGRPVDLEVIEKAFNRLKKEHDLPDVVFHSLRHASTTYKLGMTNGDIKSVQGDTGHASSAMVTDLYAHILDDRRKNTAQIFDKVFYQQPDIRPNSNDSQENDTKPSIDPAGLLKLIQESPELKETLKQLLSD